jgi:hypothetical protein
MLARLVARSLAEGLVDGETDPGLVVDQLVELIVHEPVSLLGQRRDPGRRGRGRFVCDLTGADEHS